MTQTMDWDIKVGKTSTRLVKLDDLHIPLPDQIIYSDYVEEQERGDRSWVGAGTKTIKWVWDIMAGWQVALLNEILQTSSATITTTSYIRSPKRIGYKYNDVTALTTFQVKAKRPKLDGQDGQGVARSAKAYSSVAFTFNILDEV